MPFNGLGVWERLYSWANDAANSIFVRSDRMDNEMNDMASGLSNCITRDGQSLPTTNIPFGTFKITGLGSGASPTDSVNYGQVFNSPTFVSPSASVTPAYGNSSTLLATTAFVAAVAFAAGLPAISAATRNMTITNNGTTGRWARAAGGKIYLASTAGGF